MRNFKLSILMKISLLSVIAFLLMYIELPIPIFPEFLKIDISDLPALIGSFALGPIVGVSIELVKNILHLIFKGGTAGIGEFANFVVGAVLVFTAGFFYKGDKSKFGAVKSLIVGTVFMSITASLLNYFVLLPLYEAVLKFPIAAVVGMGNKLNSNIKDLNTFIIWAILPFNILKGVVVSAITLGLYKSVSPLLHKEANELERQKSIENIH